MRTSGRSTNKQTNKGAHVYVQMFMSSLYPIVQQDTFLLTLHMGYFYFILEFSNLVRYGIAEFLNLPVLASVSK